LVLAAYGVVAALQPISEFGRLYAAYGGIFIALALLCGVVVDGFRPDRWDLLGATICVVGVLVMVALPEGIERRERTLFTEVPRRGILGSSDAGSCIAPPR
jgi:small multidrug resistance family-3 protein